jgi:uridine kinase
MKQVGKTKGTKRAGKTKRMKTAKTAGREVSIEVEGSGRMSVPSATTPRDIMKKINYESEYRVVAARFNNKVVRLSYPLATDGTLCFIALDSSDGMSVYRRSLAFVMIRAARELFPEGRVHILHSLSKGYYCELRLDRALEVADLKKLESRMTAIVEADEPFVRREVPVEEALRIFEKDGQIDKVGILKYRTEPTVAIYQLGGFTDYFYGCLAPSTGYVDRFELRDYPPGFILRFPLYRDPKTIPGFHEQKKMAEVFREYVRWGQILGIEKVGDINEIVGRGDTAEMVRVAEALHEKKMAYLADVIDSKLTRPRLVLISGPSGSGKTTFSKRLSIQMRVNGLKNVTISLDNYFLDREETPRDETGEYDFEAPEAIDIELLNSQLLDLFAGKEVDVPRFSFRYGKRIGYRKFKIDPDRILILEGIHAINPMLTPSIPSIMKFKVYVSALSQLNIDYHNRVPTTDVRKLRRIVRDNLFRGYNAVDTLSRWASVRRGEDQYIFPFQEEADAMFNSSLPYELCVIKERSEELLSRVTNEVEEYAEARRLLRFLSYFVAIPPREVPRNSILREFIGGSIFKY